MKKWISVLLSVFILMTFAACGSATSVTQTDSGQESQVNPGTTEGAETQSDDTETNGVETAESDSRILIAYFTKTGNTETIAEMIEDETGGDLFRIETVEEYPDDYQELIDLAQDEQNEDARPGLKSNVSDLDDYDIIFIGYPNWWGDMPMAVYTFIESHEWQGKTVVPFCTHGGSGLSDTMQTITDICSGATILDGLAVRDTNIDSAGPDVQDWISGLGMETK